MESIADHQFSGFLWKQNQEISTSFRLRRCYEKKHPSEPMISFPVLISILQLLRHLQYSCPHNSDPFPLMHPDLYQNNIVVEDNYKIPGVVDWEGAYYVPWKLGTWVPTLLSIICPPVHAPWNYNSDGQPKHRYGRRGRIESCVRTWWWSRKAVKNRQ